MHENVKDMVEQHDFHVIQYHQSEYTPHIFAKILS